MQFRLLTNTPLALQPQLQWLWYSNQTGSLIVGDDRAAFAMPVSNPGVVSPLPAGGPFDANASHHHPCNLPVPASLYEEFTGESWHGFRFLECSAYDRAVDPAGHPVGDLLRTLIFGPDYGHYMLHPSSGLILSLRSGSVELLQRTPGGFKSLDKTKTRGRAALAFAAHPEETLVAYGDNFGTFHAHRFDPAQFGRASKIAEKERKASRLEFVRAGRMLVIGGMGYLATYSYAAGKFAPLHEVSIPVRDFIWLNDGELVLVNQGMHGVTAYHYGPSGFSKLGAVQPDGAVQQMAVSKCQRYLAVSDQESGKVSMYSLSPE